MSIKEQTSSSHLKTHTMARLAIFTTLLALSTSAPTPSTSDEHLSKIFKVPLPTKPAPPKQCPISFAKNFIPQGYPFETHTVTTADGYILTLFRFQKTFTTIKNSGLPVVFVQHGMDNGAVSWLMNGEQGLVFLLANAGYDVWLGNNRGSKYSRKHVSLSINSKAFWTFSFDEMAKFDLPANLGYVRKTTGGRKITYIGHSQGTTQMFAALSDSKIRPNVAPYINRFYALAPIVYLNHNTTPIPNYAAYLTKLVKDLATAFDVNYLNLGTCVFDQASVDYWNKYCPSHVIKCYGPSFKLLDNDPYVDNWARTGYHNLATPSGVSANSFLHYAQILERQNTDQSYFAKYDYGNAVQNFEHYGQTTAPSYDLGLVEEQVHLWVGSGDHLATEVEAELIEQAMVNAQTQTHIIPHWGHTTFHFGKESATVYKQLVDEIRELNAMII